MVRSVFSAISKFEKSPLFVKLKAARMRIRRDCTLQRQRVRNQENPQLLKELYRLASKTRFNRKRMSYKRVAIELFEMGTYEWHWKTISA